MCFGMRCVLCSNALIVRFDTDQSDSTALANSDSSTSSHYVDGGDFHNDHTIQSSFRFRNELP